MSKLNPINLACKIGVIFFNFIKEVYLPVPFHPTQFKYEKTLDIEECKFQPGNEF